MFEQRFCGECGQMKDQCICLETGHIDEILDLDVLFPMSDIEEMPEDEDIWVHDSGDTKQDNAITVNGVELTDEELEWMYGGDIEAERAAEARMGGDNHYYPESYEEAEQRFVDSLPPAGVDPELWYKHNS